jgi:hypothetical protein
MTVIADSRKRVILRPAKPGDRFDVQVSPEGKLILTPLVPATKADKIRLVQKHGYTVGVGTRPITQEQVRALLDEFP